MYIIIIRFVYLGIKYVLKGKINEKQTEKTEYIFHSALYNYFVNYSYSGICGKRG